MASENLTLFIGFISIEPEMRYTSGGKAVCNFSINAPFTKNKPCFIDCVAWEKTAEIASEAVKGQNVYIKGHMQLDQWQAKDGTNRQKLKCIVDYFQFLSRDTEVPDSQKSQEPDGFDDEIADSEIPF